MFKERLNELIESKCNGKQIILSKETGIAQGTISCYFTRNSLPSAEQLIILANYFDCSVDYLLGRENEYGIIESQNQLTKIEDNLITLFRSLNEHDKHKLIGFAQALAY